MYEIISTVIIVTIIITSVNANYDRYGQTDRYGNQYTTISSLYNQFPYKFGYNNDVSRFPDDQSRYPNYNQNGYTTKNYYNSGSQGNQLYPGHSTSRYADGYSSYEFPFMKDEREYCRNRVPQIRIIVESLMGMWYGVEYIQHLAGDSRVDYARTCIAVHISEPAEEPSTENQHYHVQHINAKFRQEYRHLRLLWDEAGVRSEYALYFRNDSSGYWQVDDDQNGTLTRVPGYQHFSGSVQVLKAVNDHLLLNFCQEPHHGRAPQLYSVLFSREPGVMPRWEINSVHSLLQTKNLSVASRRMVCGNSGTMIKFSAIFSVLSSILAYSLSVSS